MLSNGSRWDRRAGGRVPEYRGAVGVRCREAVGVNNNIYFYHFNELLESIANYVLQRWDFNLNFLREKCEIQLKPCL